MICLSISLIFQCGAIQKVWFCLSVNVTFLQEFVAKHNFGRLYSDWIISCKRQRYKLPWCVIWLMILLALQEKFAFASYLIILLIVDVRVWFLVLPSYEVFLFLVLSSYVFFLSRHCFSSWTLLSKSWEITKTRGILGWYGCSFWHG